MAGSFQGRQIAREAGAVVLVGILLTIAAAFGSWRVFQTQYERRIDATTTGVQSLIEQRLLVYSSALRGVRSFFTSQTAVSPEDFETYVQSLELSRFWPGTLGVGYAQQVDPEDARDFEQRLSGAYPGFRIQGEPHPGPLFPVVFFSRVGDTGQKLIGVDYVSEPVHAEAMRLAAQSDAPVLTGPIYLLGMPKAGPTDSLALILPVFRGKSNERLSGVLFSPMRSADFFHAVLAGLDESVAVSVHDVTGDQRTMIFRNQADIEPGALSAAGHRKLRLDVFQREWEVSIRVSPWFFGARLWAPFITACAGFALSFLVGYFTWTQTEGRRNAEALLAGFLESQLALTESNRATMDILENLTDAFFLLDDDGSVTYANPQACAMFGRKGGECNGLDFARLFPNGVEDDLKRAIERRVPWTRDAWAPTLGLWLQIHLNPTTRGIAVYVQDLTARKRYELLLAESEQRYRSLFAFSPDAAFTVDLEGRITSLNPAAIRKTGYSEEEVRGQPFPPIIPEDVRVASLAAFQRASNGESVEMRTAFLTKDGKRIEAHLMAGPIIVGGEIQGVFGVARDITDEKRAEAVLSFIAGIGARLSATLDFDQIGEIVTTSTIPLLGAACVVCICPPDESTRSHMHHHGWRKEAALVDLARVMCLRIHELRACGTIEGAWVNENPDALLERFHPEVAALAGQAGVKKLLWSPLRHRGEGLGLIVFLRQTNARDFTREDLRIANDVARRASMAVENAVLYQRAKEAIRARDEFLSIGSHELKTPVTSIQLQIQLLLAGLRGELPPPTMDRLASSLATTDSQVNRLVRLINELLDVSRLTTGNLRLQKEQMNLSAAALEVVERFKVNPENVEIRAAIEPGIVGTWDRLRIDQVMTNLISNALKYGNKKPVSVALHSDEGAARISVSDQGVGISEEDVARIFGRFERALTAATRNIGGLGMGLYIVRQIVEAHGGNIQVISRPGKGSTFIVELPLMPADQTTGHS